MAGDVSASQRPASVIRTSSGRSLAFCEWGDPGGAPVVFCHGTPGSRLLRLDSAQYVTRDLRVITYDRPGYGLSTRVPDRQVSETADDVEVLADSLGLEQFAVAGVSSGGLHALAVAAALPERVSRCASIKAVAPYHGEGLDFYAGMDEEGQAEFHKALAGPEAVHEVYAEFEAWVHQGLPGIELPPAVMVMLTEAFEEAIRQGEAGFVDDYLATVRPLGFDPTGVSAPTRLLMARQDTTVPPGHGVWWQDNLPDAHVSWFDGTHMDPAPDDAEIELIDWAAHGDQRAH